jgi:voltage-gated potassium channel
LVTWWNVDRAFGVFYALLCGWLIPVMFLLDHVDPEDWNGLAALRDFQISVMGVVHFFIGFMARRSKPDFLFADLAGRNTERLGWVYWFAMRFLLAFPFFGFLGFFEGSDSNLFLLIKLLALVHLGALFHLEDMEWYLGPIQARLVPLLVIVPLAIHIAAIGWIGLAGEADPKNPVVMTIFERYTRAVYWATSTLATVGYGDITAVTVPQMWYSIMVEITGVGFFGFVLTNIASILGRLDSTRQRRTEWLERVNAFLGYHQLPSYLRRRVFEYNRYLWDAKRGYNDSELLESFPVGLKTQILLHIHGRGLSQVPLFREAGPELLREIVLELKPLLACPGEEIFKIGESAEGMYFIERGQVAIINGSGVTITTLNEGAFFGEMALVHNRPRGASARAVAYTELYMLDRSSFNRAMERHPEFAKTMKETTKIRESAMFAAFPLPQDLRK